MQCRRSYFTAVDVTEHKAGRAVRQAASNHAELMQRRARARVDAERNGAAAASLPLAALQSDGNCTISAYSKTNRKKELQ